MPTEVVPWTRRSFWKKPANHKVYFDWLGKRVQVLRMQDWYSITKQVICDNHGSEMLASYYSNSSANAIRCIYPHHEWLDWQFADSDPDHWNDPRQRRRFFQWLGTKLSFTSMEDWYLLNIEQARMHGGASLLATFFDDRVCKAIISTFSEHPWIIWKFNSVPEGFWLSISNHRSYFEWLGDQLSFNKKTDWYYLTNELVYHHHGQGLLHHYYSDSACKAVMSIFSDHPWVVWKFKQVPHGLWEHSASRRSYFQWLSVQLGYHNMENWYSITQQAVLEHHGGGLLEYYGLSAPRAVIDVFREHQWDVWKFEHMKFVPETVWEDMEEQRRYLEWFTTKRKMKDPHDWYEISKKILHDSDSASLVAKRYAGSLYHTLASLYPDHPWHWWRFADTRLAKDFWQDISNHRVYAQYLSELFNITAHEDWYSITGSAVKRVKGGSALLSKYGRSLHRTLASLFPDRVWEFWPKFGRAVPAKQSGQLRLQQVLCSLGFLDLVVEYRSSKLVSPTTYATLALDLYSPSHSIAFEYHGEHHFIRFKHGMPGHFLEDKTRKDRERRLVCAQNDITLVMIPYWWDGKPASLVATIRKYRPDLLMGFAGGSEGEGMRPIKDPYVEGTMMSKQDFLLEEKLKEDQDPCGW